MGKWLWLHHPLRTSLHIFCGITLTALEHNLCLQSANLFETLCETDSYLSYQTLTSSAPWKRM